jgi:hypothetical protein
VAKSILRVPSIRSFELGYSLPRDELKSRFVLPEIGKVAHM